MQISLTSKAVASVIAAASLTAANAGTIGGSDVFIEYDGDMGAGSTYATPQSAFVSWFRIVAAPEGSFSAIVHADPTSEYLTIATNMQMQINAPVNPQLRFSQWKVEFDVTLTRLSDGAKIVDSHTSVLGGGQSGAGNGFNLNSFKDGLAIGSDYMVTGHYKFSPGNYLAPSDDPSCASLACMKQLQDTTGFATANVYIATFEVPEPSQYALLIGGLAALSVYKRKRNT